MTLPVVGVPRKWLWPALSSHLSARARASLRNCLTFCPPPPGVPSAPKVQLSLASPLMAAGPKAAEQRRAKGHGHFCHSG